MQNTLHHKFGHFNHWFFLAVFFSFEKLSFAVPNSNLPVFLFAVFFQILKSTRFFYASIKKNENYVRILPKLRFSICRFFSNVPVFQICHFFSRREKKRQISDLPFFLAKTAKKKPMPQRPQGINSQRSPVGAIKRHLVGAPIESSLKG